MIPNFVPTLRNSTGKSLAMQFAESDALVRLAILRCGLMVVILVGVMAVTGMGPHATLWLWWLRLTVGLLLLGAIGLLAGLWSRPTRGRYQIMPCALFDVGGIGCLGLFFEHLAIPFFFMGLCLVIAYGFRYGTAVMLFALTAFATTIIAGAWIQLWGTERQTAGFMLVASAAFTAFFVQLHHVRLTRTRIRLQGEIDAHADFIAVLGDELRMSVDKLVGGPEAGALKSRGPGLPHSAYETITHFLRPLPDDILDYCAVMRGGFSVTPQDFNLFECVHRTLRSFRQHALHQEQRISLQLDPALPFSLHGDERRLHRALLHVLCDTLRGCSAGRFLLRLTSESDGEAQIILRQAIFRVGAASPLSANQNFLAVVGGLPLRVPGLAGRMADHLAPALGGELVRRPPTDRRMVELALPLRRQGARVPQGTLDGMEALAIGFEEGSLMRLCTQLERWSALTLSAVGLSSANAMLSDARQTNRQISLILLHVDAARDGVDGSDSGPDLARNVADATELLRRHCAPCVSIVLCVEDQIRSSVAGLLDGAPELLSVLESPIQPEELFNVASAAHAAWPAEAVCTGTISTVPSGTGISSPAVGHSSILAPVSSAHGGTDTRGTLWTADHASTLPVRPVAGQAIYRILIAESNPTNAMVLRKIVERGGHHCELVSDGGLALDRLTSDRFDAAVLDENLPVMSGYELAKAYHYIAQPDERAAIILCTGEPESDVVTHCGPGVVSGCVSLPVTAPGLLGELDRAIAFEKDAASNNHPASRPTNDFAVLQTVAGEARDLDHDVLAELEEISPDPAFLDRLLNGFVHDNRAMLDRLHRAVQADRKEEVRQLLHAIKGSAVSVGAVALKDLCCHLEKLAAQSLPDDSEPMMASLETGFRRFCDALECWRAQRQLRVPR
jgi:CheY-like chemotaxis protein/HPt (histidine-containing phosphotransfer) domain-containing protein/signal transduction histidine kinase